MPTIYAALVMVGTIRFAHLTDCVRRDDSSCLARPNPAFFTSEPFPLRPKTLYGAPRFAFGEMNS